jgi:hypothetical protein
VENARLDRGCGAPRELSNTIYTLGAGPAFRRSNEGEGAPSFSAFCAERVGHEALSPEGPCQPYWVLSRMATLPYFWMGIARSGTPSWLKSAGGCGVAAVRVDGFLNLDARRG